MRFEAEFLNQDLHTLLGVPSGASEQQIRAAYRLRARASHPDLNPHDPEAGQRMAQLNRAARVLLDPALRRHYEQARRRAFGGPSETCSRRTWFDAAPSADAEWGPVQVDPPATPSPAQRAFRRSVRHVGSGLAARAQDLLLGVGGERRLAVAALCIALGSGLLVWSHPSNAFWTRPGTQTASAGP